MLDLKGKKRDLKNNGKIKWSSFYKIIKISPDEIYITHGLRSAFSFSIVDKLGLKVLDKIADNLQSWISLDELFKLLKVEEENKSYLIEVLTSLCERGIIVKDKEYPYSYYGVYYEELSKLSHANIGIIGIGPLGIRNIFALLSMEIGKTINVLGGGRISISPQEKHNFPIFFRDFIDSSGSLTNALRNFLSENGRHAEKVNIIEGFNKESLKEFLRSTDIVLVAFENFFPRIFYETNILAHEERTPVLYTYLDGGLGIVGPLVIPGETACFACFGAAMEASVLHPSFFISYKSYMDKSYENILFGGATPIYDILSGFTVDCLIRFFSGPESVYVLNRVFLLNFEALEIDVQDLLKNPNCGVCSKIEPPAVAPVSL